MDTYEKICQAPLGIGQFSHLTKDTPEGLIMEFGVGDGGSLKSLAGVAQQLNRTVYGFDWFMGLPEDCGGADQKGSFSTGGKLPSLSNHPNVEIIKGLFQDTLSGFLEEHQELMAFVHIDVDLYSSAAFILSHIEKRLQSGTILAFDEMVDWHNDLPADHYGHWRNSEYKAFNEMLARNVGMTWKCLSRGEANQVAIKILST